jgi:4-diphosphocytidyl-2-C-methyl-D-erythritol kinase
MHETAYAKLNLALHVRERLTGGYHRIETLFAFAEDGDGLRARPADILSLEVEGRFAEALGETEDNLVLRAAQALRTHCPSAPGAAIILDKRLPVASGVGGGSADAAAALRLLSRLWGFADRHVLFDIAQSLGADVPACLASTTMRGEGRGDILDPWPEAASLSGTPLLLVNPLVPVPTAAVFRRWDGVDQGALPSDPAAARNGLEAPALEVAPVIAEVLAELRRAAGAGLVRMSGSGATCFALFNSDAARNAAVDAVASRRPDWWQLPTRLR